MFQMNFLNKMLPPTFVYSIPASVDLACGRDLFEVSSLVGGQVHQSVFFQVESLKGLH